MNKVVGILVISAGLMCGTIARAVPITLDYDGIKWSWELQNYDVLAGSGSILLKMDPTSPAPPGSTAYLHSFLLKGADGYDPFTVASASISSGNETWTRVVKGELDANGCKSNGNNPNANGHNSSMCFSGDPDLDVTNQAKLTLQINFVLSAGVLPDALHLKTLWVTTQKEVCTQANIHSPKKCGFTKVGDLVSQDFLRTPYLLEPFKEPLPEPVLDLVPSAVPLPGTLALFGLGLLTMVFRRRASA
jgi:hypothetical protein